MERAWVTPHPPFPPPLPPGPDGIRIRCGVPPAGATLPCVSKPPVGLHVRAVIRLQLALTVGAALPLSPPWQERLARVLTNPVI
jgi:hypothetical protein